MDDWKSIKIESEDDRSTIVAILARNGYEVRIKKVKIKNRYERYAEFREQEGGRI